MGLGGLLLWGAGKEGVTRDSYLGDPQSYLARGEKHKGNIHVENLKKYVFKNYKPLTFRKITVTQRSVAIPKTAASR